MTRAEAIEWLEYHIAITDYDKDDDLLKALQYAVRKLKTELVKHGRWEWNKRLGKWYCSNCDRIMTPYIVEKSEGEYEMAQPNYCGWCGARMSSDE